jgi:hypothetical protein
MHLPYRLEDELGSKLEQLEEQLKDKMEEETKLRHTILFCHIHVQPAQYRGRILGRNPDKSLKSLLSFIRETTILQYTSHIHNFLYYYNKK